MLKIMVIGFCLFCTLPFRKAETKTLSKWDIDEFGDNYFNDVKLYERDENFNNLDSDEDEIIIYQIKSPKKHESNIYQNYENKKHDCTCGNGCQCWKNHPKCNCGKCPKKNHDLNNNKRKLKKKHRKNIPRVHKRRPVIVQPRRTEIITSDEDVEDCQIVDDHEIKLNEVEIIGNNNNMEKGSRPEKENHELDVNIQDDGSKSDGQNGGMQNKIKDGLILNVNNLNIKNDNSMEESKILPESENNTLSGNNSEGIMVNGNEEITNEIEVNSTSSQNIEVRTEAVRIKDEKIHETSEAKKESQNGEVNINQNGGNELRNTTTQNGDGNIEKITTEDNREQNNIQNIEEQNISQENGTTTIRVEVAEVFGTNSSTPKDSKDQFIE